MLAFLKISLEPTDPVEEVLHGSLEVLDLEPHGLPPLRGSVHKQLLSALKTLKKDMKIEKLLNNQ